VCRINLCTQILPKIGCHGNVPYGTGKSPRSIMYEQLPIIWRKKIVKIGQVDPEITGLKAVIKNEKKLVPAKHIALLASLLSGLYK